MNQATVIADSVTIRGHRLITIEVTLPRCVLAEFNTHRTHSRNSASSRAIPAHRLISAITSAPFIPTWTAANRGMVASGLLADIEGQHVADQATTLWLAARDAMVRFTAELTALGVAKQDANRLLEPFTFTTIVATATEQAWRWFFGLRDSEQADPKFAVPARMMHEAYKASKPRPLRDGDWHLPYIGDADIAAVRRDYGFCDVPHLDDLSATDRTEVQQTLAKMSAARCARISYLRQHEERELSDELLRHHELVRMRHWSPTEHQAPRNASAVRAGSRQ